MKFSELWLREWVNTSLDSEALSTKSPWQAWKLTALSRCQVPLTVWLWGSG
jgi:hypothetical protein